MVLEEEEEEEEEEEDEEEKEEEVEVEVEEKEGEEQNFLREESLESLDGERGLFLDFFDSFFFSRYRRARRAAAKALLHCLFLSPSIVLQQLALFFCCLVAITHTFLSKQMSPLVSQIDKSTKNKIIQLELPKKFFCNL